MLQKHLQFQELIEKLSVTDNAYKICQTSRIKLSSAIVLTKNANYNNALKICQLVNLNCA